MLGSRPRKSNPLFEPVLFEVAPGYNGPNSQGELIECLESLISTGQSATETVLPINGESIYAWERKTVCCRLAFLALSLNGLRAAQAISFLVSHNLADQATQIGRALFESAINAGFMATGDGLAEQFFAYSNVLAMRSLKAARGNPLAGWAKTVIEHSDLVATIESAYDAYCAYFQVDPTKKPPTSWTNLDLRARSERAGMDYEPLYQWFCQFAHVSVQGVSQLLQSGEGPETFVAGSRSKTPTLLFSAIKDLSVILDLFSQAWDLPERSRLVRLHLSAHNSWPRLFYVADEFFGSAP